MAISLMTTLPLYALSVSVDGHGEIPAEGMEITITDAEEDLLSGDMTMKVNGTLLCQGTLQVTINRSATELTDEFCCANQCTGGNEELTEQLTFEPGGKANWYVHYTPALGSKETITYTFFGENTTRTLTVHYDYSTQGVETVSGDRLPVTGQKILKDGIIYIIKDNKSYTIL